MADVKKFYPSLNTKILKTMFRRKIKDKDCLWLIDLIIDTLDVGVPIGNYTSPWFANFYFEQLDHMIKGLPGIKYYVRYTDNLVFFGPDKKKLHKGIRSIMQYLAKVSMRLNEDWQVFRVDVRDVNFLGQRFYRNKTVLTKKNMLRMTRRARKISKKEYLGHRDARAIISAWGWIKRTDSYRLYNEKIKPYVSVNKARKVVRMYDKRKHAKTGDLRRSA